MIVSALLSNAEPQRHVCGSALQCNAERNTKFTKKCSFEHTEGLVPPPQQAKVAGWEHLVPRNLTICLKHKGGLSQGGGRVGSGLRLRIRM